LQVPPSAESEWDALNPIKILDSIELSWLVGRGETLAVSALKARQLKELKVSEATIMLRIFI